MHLFHGHEPRPSMGKVSRSIQRHDSRSSYLVLIPGTRLWRLGNIRRLERKCGLTHSFIANSIPPRAVRVCTQAFTPARCALLVSFARVESLGYCIRDSHRCMSSGVSPQICGVVKDKATARSDWRQRPLSRRMMDYARKDTHYLARASPTTLPCPAFA